MEKRKTEVDRTSGKPEQEGLLKYMLENGMISSLNFLTDLLVLIHSNASMLYPPVFL